MLAQVAHYNLLELVGEGGMGEVCRARDTRLGRTVAVKVLPDYITHSPERRERFLRDARAVATVSHPNIATLFDIVEEGGDLCLVFEYVPGRSLAAEIGGRPMNTRTALELAAQLADAVADAHAAGVLHRDLRPENIIVSPRGRAKILDFGFSAWTRGGAARDRAVPPDRTEAVAVSDVLAYLSPEQACGAAVDERSDIFSLGIVIFEMLTGRNPFARTAAGAGPVAVAAIVHGAAPPASRVHRDLPAALDPILAKALARDPNGRYQTAAALAAELRAALAVLEVRGHDTEPRPRVPPRRPDGGRSWRWIVVLLVAVALALAGWLWWGDLTARWSRHAMPRPILVGVPAVVPGAGRLAAARASSVGPEAFRV
jgi:serine/threonine protein kinase